MGKNKGTMIKTVEWREIHDGNDGDYWKLITKMKDEMKDERGGTTHGREEGRRPPRLAADAARALQRQLHVLRRLLRADHRPDVDHPLVDGARLRAVHQLAARQKVSSGFQGFQGFQGFIWMCGIEL